MEGAAVKVPPEEQHIEIRGGDDVPTGTEEAKDFAFVPYVDRPWDEIGGDTIVLNKPVGYVSGQEEHEHVPAVRLLTRRNIHLADFDEEERQQLSKRDSVLQFDRRNYLRFDNDSSVPKHIRKTLTDGEESQGKKGFVETLSGYAVAGRLDINSTGIMIFTRAGIMARRLIEPQSRIRKTYIVKVQPAVQPTAQERELGLRSLPNPTRDLRVLLQQGNRLLGHATSLKPLVKAEWLDGDDEEEQTQETFTMRLVMVEGRKRQIRHMCRQLLGWHVVELERTDIGPVRLGSLPEGKWRPLTQDETKSIFGAQPDPSKNSISKRKNSRRAFRI